ncbi:iron/zinc/copper transport system ATP-binding protein [Amphibacillus marinus]|uniref:Iron/zinc/copper transport system ATP-binding protein n=2 Tax=Amphibacillus marinus TaxID=872970 RepID=A0A1H8KI44_9BACI|nr:iron/zinc/copper transport system ATP-binding protein [Amphibacillus marinus]
MITVKDLYVSYQGTEAIQNVSFQVNTGQLVGIIGPNGAGKSTLLKALLGLVPIDRGEITINNKPLKQIRRNIAYVPQRNIIDWDFPITVLDTVVMGNFPNLTLFKRPSKQQKAFALSCLEKVQMADLRHRQISELSGGQQQRVFLARALTQNPDFFFLDEPFVGIDAASEALMIKLLHEQSTQGKTILIVHHDLSKLNSYFDQIILLNKALISYGAPRETATAKHMNQAYNGQLAFWSESGESNEAY